MYKYLISHDEYKTDKSIAQGYSYMVYDHKMDENYIDPNESIGFINFSVEYNNYHNLRSRQVFKRPNTHVIDLYIAHKYRNKGYGTMLLQYVISFCKNKFNVSEINLEDMSDNYRKKRNIYLKHGFKYNTKDGCEMRLQL
jgi:GNAT superfamily N-acetyltransferase